MKTDDKTIADVIFGLRPLIGSNEMDAGVELIEALAEERKELRQALVGHLPDKTVRAIWAALSWTFEEMDQPSESLSAEELAEAKTLFEVFKAELGQRNEAAQAA